MAYRMGDMRISQTLDVSGELIKDNLKDILRIGMYMMIPTTVIVSLIVFYLDPSKSIYGALDQIIQMAENPEAALPDQSMVMRSVASSMLQGLFGMVNLLLLVPVTSGAVCRLLASRYLGVPITPRESFRWAFKNYGKLLVAMILYLLIVVAALVLVGIVVGVVIALLAAVGAPSLILVVVGLLLGAGGSVAYAFVVLRYILYFPALVVEGAAYASGLRRSAYLMKDHIWRIFWLLAIVNVITFLVVIVQFFIPVIWLSVVLISLVTAVTGAFEVCVVLVYYFNCRCAHENFDITWLTQHSFPQEDEGQGESPELSHA